MSRRFGNLISVCWMRKMRKMNRGFHFKMRRRTREAESGFEIGSRFFRHWFLPVFCWGYNFSPFVPSQHWLGCSPSSVVSIESPSTNSSGSRLSGRIMSVSSSTPRSLRSSLSEIFSSARSNNRFCQRDQAVVFDLFEKLAVRELSFGQKRRAQFLDVQGYGFS